MQRNIGTSRLAKSIAIVVLGLGTIWGHGSLAEPTHGIAMHGTPALAPDFVSLPYANPDAPKGGGIVFGESGSFDSLNPFILKGNVASGVSVHTVESLMMRSFAEPFTLYGLLAESVETDETRSFVEFTLNPRARFSDGTSVTVDDVLWSFETLGTIGNPRYHDAWKKVAKAEAVGANKVRFTFNTPDRELPLILGLRPVLKKAQWEGKVFEESSLDPVIGSGAYVVDKVDPGVSVTYRRNPDWWAKDLPITRGMQNLETIRYDYFSAGGAVVFEAFKSGAIDVFRESSPAKWATNYDFPAITGGSMIKEEILHARPSGIEGFVFNTRRPLFADWRVREALTQAFNWELVNQTLFAGLQPRIVSYFGNSGLAGDMTQPADPAIQTLLQPFADSLLPGALEGYTMPVSDGTEQNRAGIRTATTLLAEAGWSVDGQGVLVDAQGNPFAFELLVTNGADEVIAIASIYAQALKALGIEVKVTTIDAAQMKERTTTYDFDMTHYIRSVSLSPGNEQTLYWGSAGVEKPGTRNWMGVASPALDNLMAAMLTATDRETFVVHVRALDRVLTSGRYVIPFGFNKASRIAHAARLKHPETLPLYGDWPGFTPEAWWQE